MAKRSQSPRRTTSPLATALVRTVESRLEKMEALLLEMRGEQDRHLKRLTDLDVQMDLIAEHVRLLDREPAPRAPARPGRGRPPRS